MELNFEQAYKIYSIRWSVEVLFKESMQYLGLGKCRSKDFIAQIAHTTIGIIQYNLLSVAKRFAHCESLGDLFRNIKAETIHITVAEQLCQIIVDVLADLAELPENELLMEKLINHNDKLVKRTNYRTLLINGY